MSSRGGTAEDPSTVHLSHESSLDRKSVDTGMRLVIQPSSLQQSARAVNPDQAAVQNTLKTGLMTSMKPSLQPVFGISQTGAVFPRTSNSQPVQPNLTLRPATPVVVEKCDAAPVALQLSMPVTTSAPLYRLMSPGTVVNVSQKTSSASLTGVAPSPLVNMFGGATSSVAGSGGLGRPAMATTTTNATVLHTIRPVATHPIALPPSQQVRSGGLQPHVPSTTTAVLSPRTSSQLVSLTQTEPPKILAHGHVPRGAAAAAIVLAPPRTALATPRPNQLSAAVAQLSAGALHPPFPLLSAGSGSSTSAPLISLPSRAVVATQRPPGSGSSTSAPLISLPSRAVVATQRPPSSTLSVIQSQRPAVLSSQSWPLQTQPQLLTVTPPTVTSSASVQLSRSQESLMQSTIHRPLTFSQQIRPQQPQLAVVTQKPMLSVTRHAEGVVVGQNFIPSSSRPSTLAAAVAHAHQMANTQLIGQSHAINLSAAAPKPQKIVLAQPRSTAIASAPVTAVNLSKTGQLTSPLNLTQHRQPKPLKTQSSGLPASTVSAYSIAPLALTTSKSAAVACVTVTSVHNSGLITTFAGSGPPAHHLQSAGDMSSSVTRQATSVFSSHLTSGTTSPNTQPVRFTAAHNAVLLGTYGLAPAHSGHSGLPATLHPIFQAVDTRQVADRPQATQSFIGQYATQVVTFPRLDHPPQHPLSSVVTSMPVNLLSPHNISNSSMLSNVHRVNLPAVVVTASPHIALPLAAQRVTAPNAATKLIQEGSATVAGQMPTIVALNFNKPPPLSVCPQTCAVSESMSSSAQSVTSPRPGILRKRAHDATLVTQRTSVKRNLHSGGYVMESLESCTIALPSPKICDGSRDNSRSSTDTASSVESSPCTGTTLLSTGFSKDDESDVKPESGRCDSYRSSQRKKPRKQSLRSHEEVRGELPMEEDIVEKQKQWISVALRTESDSALNSKHNVLPLESEYTDDEGVRFTLDVQSPSSRAVSIAGSYHCSWKPRNNHFQNHIDFKPKDDRRPTVNELANQKGVGQRSSGWKLQLFAAEFDALAQAEHSVLEEVSSLRDIFCAKKLSVRHMSTSRDDDGARIISELVEGNIQRCSHYMDQINDVKSSLERFIEERRPRAVDIISRHQSKRAMKKKERL